jgi:hypothetical protein
MKKWKFSTTLAVGMMTLLLSSAGGSFAATHKQPGAGPMKPELAAKKEMIRKQHEQRVSPAKRKVAIDALKEERLKVYRAKQAVKQAAPVNN